MTKVIHRRYVSHGDAHYAGGLVDGAYALRIFGEIATELSIVDASDEGLLAGYESVAFHTPIYAGDIVEAHGEIVSAGRRSRRVDLVAYVTARGASDAAQSAATTLDPPIRAVTAVATLVVPEPAAPASAGAHTVGS